MESLNFEFHGQPQQLTEGIYFGMPEDFYHSIPALSSTGLKNVLISAPDFYANSWLNPYREEDAEDDEAKEWRKFGKASHTRNLEGKTVFNTLYCPEFIPPEGCLKTKEDLTKYCDDNGITVTKSWAKPKVIATIKTAGHNPLIYDEAEENYFRETGGKIQLSQKEIRHIEVAAAMIEKHPELKHCFVGGHPEVTIIWQGSDGLWLKARLDYLKPRAIVDLKTFTNKNHKPIDKALHETMAGLKYHIQVVLYTMAGAKAIEFAQKNMITVYSPQRYKPTDDFIKQLAESKGHEFFLVFQKKGGAPLARGKKFHGGLSMYKCAEVSIMQAIETYKKYYALFGKEIWVDVSSITDFEDDMFPAYATEI